VRRFLLVAHDARTAPDFSLDDLPGSGGRMDLVARCVTAGLLVSHDVRLDTEFLAVLLGPPKPPRLVRFVGGEIRGLNPDERSTAALIRKALEEEGRAERAVRPGLYVSGMGLDDVLRSPPGPLVLLLEGSPDLRASALPRDATFVLSDHRDFTPEEASTLMAAARLILSVGPRSLQTDQAITVVHNELDRRG